MSQEEKTFVIAACVQRSSVLRRTKKPGEEEEMSEWFNGVSVNFPCYLFVLEIDFLSCNLDSLWGVHTGGCGHVMHASCWRK